MATLDQLFVEINRVGYDEKVYRGRRLYQGMIQIIEKYRYGYFFVSSEEVAFRYFTLFCGADRKVSYDELYFYNAISGRNLSYDYFFNEARENHHPEMVADYKMFMRKLTSAEIGYFQTLAAIVFTLKSNPTSDERYFLLNFFS